MKRPDQSNLHSKMYATQEKVVVFEPPGFPTEPRPATGGISMADTCSVTPVANGINGMTLKAKTSQEIYKETGVLVQEVDEGQPCLTCRERCPGFTPHMFRLVCNNCKCPREAHDVYHEDYVYVSDRIGLKESPDPSREETKARSLSKGYSWVPPGLSSGKVDEYFAQLPNHKVPRIGTPGEKYRDRQLILQLPKQDLALAYCKFIEKDDSKSFDDFVNTRNEMALDIGHVEEHLESQGDCNKCHGLMPCGELAIRAPKLGEDVAWHPACFVCSVCDELLVDLTYCIREEELFCERHYAEQIKPRCSACDECNMIQCLFVGNLVVCIVIFLFVINTKFRNNLIDKWSAKTKKASSKQLPRGPTSQEQQNTVGWLSKLPFRLPAENSRTMKHTPAEQLRKASLREKTESESDSQLIFSGEYTKAMDKDWHSGHFCCWQCDESLTGQRYVLRDEHPYCVRCYEQVFANSCEECGKLIGIDSKDLSYKEKHWHEACFLCSKCRVSLVDKPFGSKAEKVYCGNCYDTSFATRCDGCGDVFRAGTKKMEYKGHQWHEKCFCCCMCKNPIGTKNFIPRENDIYCTGCYEEKYSTRCIKCNQIIASGGVTYRNEPWHRECFCCTNCSACLAGQRFTSRDDKPYCADCFGELFAKRCTACSRPITGIGGARFISFEDRNWHNDCFICALCKVSLVGKGFITDGPDILCPECAKQKLM